MKIQNVDSSLKRGISWNIQNVSGTFFFFFLVSLFVSAKVKKKTTPFISLKLFR